MARGYLFLLILGCAGCGSCLDNDMGPSGHVYGGVQTDTKLFRSGMMSSGLLELDDEHRGVQLDYGAGSLAMGFAVIDTPASFIVDTLLLPNAIYETYFRPKPPTIEDMLSELTGVR